MNDTSIHFVQMDYDSNVMLCDAWTIGERVALRRAQALAPFTETGNEITRYLLTQKVHGQANVISLYDRQTGADIRQVQEQLPHAHSLYEMQFIEGQAALYWSALAPRAFPFTQRDEKAVPLYWRTVGARVSPLTNSPRKAITPFHATLNYLYALLEGETSIALRVIGFDPSLGILHTDQEHRRSFAHDVMEAARPAVDSWLLATIAARPFTANDFAETRDGECRLTVAIRRLLSETIPLWRNAVAPIVEQIAILLAGNTVPTSLTGEKRSASRPQNNGTAKPKRQEPIRVARSCKRCGELVPKEGVVQVRLTKHPRVPLCHNWRLTVQFDPEELDGRKTR